MNCIKIRSASLLRIKSNIRKSNSSGFLTSRRVSWRSFIHIVESLAATNIVAFKLDASFPLAMLALPPWQIYRELTSSKMEKRARDVVAGGRTSFSRDLGNGKAFLMSEYRRTSNPRGEGNRARSAGRFDERLLVSDPALRATSYSSRSFVPSSKSGACILGKTSQREPRATLRPSSTSVRISSRRLRVSICATRRKRGNPGSFFFWHHRKGQWSGTGRSKTQIGIRKADTQVVGSTGLYRWYN